MLYQSDDNETHPVATALAGNPVISEALTHSRLTEQCSSPSRLLGLLTNSLLRCLNTANQPDVACS
jgi:hypothetical protein